MAELRCELWMPLRLLVGDHQSARERFFTVSDPDLEVDLVASERELLADLIVEPDVLDVVGEAEP